MNAITDFPVRWGCFFEKDVPPPPLDELIQPADWEHWNTDAFYDHLSANEVFKNGISGETCHPDSYMTLVDYKRLAVVLDALRAAYTIDDARMAQLIRHFGSRYAQPPSRMISYELRRRYPGAAALVPET